MSCKRSLETEENSILTCPGETFSEVDLDCVTTTKKKKLSSTVTDFIGDMHTAKVCVCMFVDMHVYVLVFLYMYI